MWEGSTALSARMLALSYASRPSIAAAEEPEEPAKAVRGVLNACSGSADSRDRFAAVAAVLGVLRRVSSTVVLGALMRPSSGRSFVTVRPELGR
eukprot:scaffold5377_cov61-Phaeocystis_antarctica.AAC.3